MRLAAVLGLYTNEQAFAGIENLLRLLHLLQIPTRAQAVLRTPAPATL